MGIPAELVAAGGHMKFLEGFMGLYERGLSRVVLLKDFFLVYLVSLCIGMIFALAFYLKF